MRKVDVVYKVTQWMFWLEF